MILIIMNNDLYVCTVLTHLVAKEIQGSDYQHSTLRKDKSKKQTIYQIGNVWPKMVLNLIEVN